MITAPIRPMAVADQRNFPTFSPRKITENMVMTTGAMKNSAVASDSGMTARPRKKKELAPTTSRPRRRWSGSFAVRSLR